MNNDPYKDFCRTIDLRFVRGDEFPRLLSLAHEEGLLAGALAKAGLHQMELVRDSQLPLTPLAAENRLTAFLRGIGGLVARVRLKKSSGCQ